MRKRFEQQNELDAIPITDVELYTKSRHELLPLLTALQYIFTTPALNEAVFNIVEAQVLKDKQSTGRLGMTLWEILVLGTVRLNLDLNYDMLLDQANNHRSLRSIMGVHTLHVFNQPKIYKLQTLKDNVSLLDEQTLIAINEVIVSSGHQLKKKEKSEKSEAGKPLMAFKLELKSDTYAVETNVHFPTDLNLLWDSVRKCLDSVELLQKGSSTILAGFRKLKYWHRRLKSCYRLAANIHQRKGANYQTRLVDSVKTYLQKARLILGKVNDNQAIIKRYCADLEMLDLHKKLLYYQQMLVKHIDLVDRRILKGEKIPHQEKIFSIFEEHTEWISKGKHHKKVELGHNVLITTDQYHFILDHQVVINQVDKQLVIPLVSRLQKNYNSSKGYLLDSWSFDRGFYSLANKNCVQKVAAIAVMPKPGKKTAKQSQQESSPLFVRLRKAHSAVESNINELEHSGVNKVPDKGLTHFKNYVAWGVLAYNLKRLGRILLE